MRRSDQLTPENYPARPQQRRQELTKLASKLESTYGKGKWCENPKDEKTCLDIDDITNTMAEKFDEQRLRQVLVLDVEADPTDQVRFVFLVGEPACRFRQRVRIARRSPESLWAA